MKIIVVQTKKGFRRYRVIDVNGIPIADFSHEGKAEQFILEKESFCG